jgi:hypothetical protein
VVQPGEDRRRQNASDVLNGSGEIQWLKQHAVVRHQSMILMQIE